MVGDSAQAIYGWRGARDVMTGFDGTPLSLSRSFRFGPAPRTRGQPLAVSRRRADPPDRHRPASPPRSGPCQAPDAVLCRTNVGAMNEVMHLLQAGLRTALVGGGGALRALALAAGDLKDGRRTAHPELVLFPTWGAVQDYAAHDPAGGDLQPLVDLVDRARQSRRSWPRSTVCTTRRPAQVTVSTAHKAKGREWPRVQIAADFHPPKDTDQLGPDGRPVPGPVDSAEARLAYVAVTRAQQLLDRSGLSWIDRYPGAVPTT